MGAFNYYPAGQTPDQTFGLTSFIPPVKARMILLVGHGQGECNIGDLAGCKFSSGWGGWWALKILADLFGIILVFLNTSITSKYSLKEYQFAKEWAKKKYAPLGLSGKDIWVLGHSLGSYGAGRYAFIDQLSAFAKDIAGWIVSATGPFNSSWSADKLLQLMKILLDAGNKILAVTAANDTIMGTNPSYTRQLYDKIKALDPNAHVILTEFPATEWPNDGSKVINGVTVYGSRAAHNNVLNRLTLNPIGLRPEITKGIPASLPFKMNLAQFMISNPRGSIYQPPTDAFVGPKFATSEPAPVVITPEPTPTAPAAPVYIKDINWSLEGKFYIINWRDGKDPLKVASTIEKPIKNVYDRFIKTKDDPNGHIVLTVQFKDSTLLPWDIIEKKL